MGDLTRGSLSPAENHLEDERCGSFGITKPTQMATAKFSLSLEKLDKLAEDIAKLDIPRVVKSGDKNLPTFQVGSNTVTERNDFG